MAAQKTYFVLPGIYEFYKDFAGVNLPLSAPVVEGSLTWKFLSYKVAGIEKLQNFPVSLGNIELSQGEIADCNQAMTTCSAGEGTFNPFYNFLGADFPLVNGFKRGVSSGYTGTNFGYSDLNITVDKEIIVDEFLNGRRGSFAIDIDYDQDFYLAIQINAGTITADEFPYGSGVTFVIQHTAETCNSVFTMQSNLTGLTTDIFSFGFLSGAGFFSGATDFHIVPSCYEAPPLNICEGYKTKSIGILVNIPIELPPSLIKDACCFKVPALAELNTKTTNWKNDFKAFPMQKKQTPNDEFNFYLVKCGEEIELNNNDLGTFYDFGAFEDYPDYKVFVLDWFKVLNNGNLGPGTYQLKLKQSISGFESEFFSCVYDLKVFSETAANRTVRIESTINSYLEQFDINYKNLNWKDCVRIPGMFGFMQPDLQTDKLIYQDRKNVPVKVTDLREYTLYSEMLEECSTKHLTDWILKGDKLLISDFNIMNHRSDFKDFPVLPGKIGEFNYPSGQQKAYFSATFNDLYDNKRKLNC